MMSLSMDSVSVLNPQISHTHFSVPFNKLPHCVKFNPLLKPRTFRFSANAAVPAKGLAACFLAPNRRNPFRVRFAASSSEQGEFEVKGSDEKPPNDVASEESQEAWKQALDTFTEQAVKLKGISEEAYELYSKKAIVVLKDTSEQLKIQAEQAKHDLSVAAKEIAEGGKVYLSAASENSPEVKDIVETFTSPTDDLSNISGVQDFYVGVPYGLVLSLGGFLSFMVTGSVAAIRFGVILGGVLLALSISSLKSYKRGKPSPLALKGQTAIAAILFLRELTSIGKGSSYFTALISGAAVAFYVYRIVLERNQQKGSNLEGEAES